MARKKKPVDDSPICDPAYARRIDPVWMPGPVPKRFWEDRNNRRDYLLWVAHKLRYRTMEDFYRLKLSVCYGSRWGGAGLPLHWGGAAYYAVQECFPEYDWKPWLFRRMSADVWESPANRRNYMTWLGERLGHKCDDDWYQVKRYEIRAYPWSVLIRSAKARHEHLKEWLSHNVTLDRAMERTSAAYAEYLPPRKLLEDHSKDGVKNNKKRRRKSA